MSFTKRYLKRKPVCRVSFSLSKEAAGSATTVHIVGDFNNWDPSANPMKKLKNGDFTATLPLARDKEYQFRYLLDGHRWENDLNADKYAPNEYGGENSVVVV